MCRVAGEVAAESAQLAVLRFELRPKTDTSGRPCAAGKVRPGVDLSQLLKITSELSRGLGNWADTVGVAC